MHSLDPTSPAALDAPAQPVPRVWKFWGTALWGFLIFVAMFVGQIAVVAIFVMKGGGPVDLKAAIQCCPVVRGAGSRPTLWSRC